MAGQLTHIGNMRAVNAAMMTGITSGVISPPGDYIGKISAATPSVGTSGTTITCANATYGVPITKAVPDDAVLAICDSAGAVDTMELVFINHSGGYANGTATAMTIDTHYWSVAHAAGSLVFLIAFKPWFALFTATPSDTAFGTECAMAGYARQPIPWTSPALQSGVEPPVALNAGAIPFDVHGADGSKTVGWGAIVDTSDLTIVDPDNMYGFWTFGSARTPQSGDSINAAASALTASVYH